MPEILWVNPVGTSSFDAETQELIEAIRSPQHHARIRHLDSGPPHLEYHLYEHEALSPMLQLMQEAERITKEEFGVQKLSVISAVGTREYYKKLGYTQNGPYVCKML